LPTPRNVLNQQVGRRQKAHPGTTGSHRVCRESPFRELSPARPAGKNLRRDTAAGQSWNSRWDITFIIQRIAAADRKTENVLLPAVPVVRQTASKPLNRKRICLKQNQMTTSMLIELLNLPDAVPARGEGRRGVRFAELIEPGDLLVRRRGYADPRRPRSSREPPDGQDADSRRDRPRIARQGIGDVDSEGWPKKAP